MQSTQTPQKFVKDVPSYSLQEKIKLYENENKVLRNQLVQASKQAESEVQILKEKLMKEIQEINDKELDFKLKTQLLQENYEKVSLLKQQADKKLSESQEETMKLRLEVQSLQSKLKENMQENLSLKKQISTIQAMKREDLSDSSTEIENSKKMIEDLKHKNRELENSILDLKKGEDSNVHKILEEYNKTLENYRILTKKLDEKDEIIKKNLDDSKEHKAKLMQENQELKKELKLAQKNVKLSQLEKKNFLEEIHKVKEDLKIYEHSAKSLKHCQLTLESLKQCQQDIIKILKKEAPKHLFHLIFQRIQKCNTTFLQAGPKKPLDIEDLNNSRLSRISDKNVKLTKTKRSLSLINKSRRESTEKPFNNNVNSSMCCANKRTSSPLIKSQKNLFKTDYSSNKKKTPSQKSHQPSPSNRFSPRMSEKNTQCFEPGWGNEKLSDIQNILHTATNDNSSRSRKESSKENIQRLSNKKRRDSMEKKKFEKMEYQELADEVYHLEKNLTQLKKDYKNLMAKSNSPENESSRMKLNEMAKDLEHQTEILIMAKKALKKK